MDEGQTVYSPLTPSSILCDSPCFYWPQTSVISTVTKIPALVDHVPLISQEDLKAGAQVLSTPNLFYVPFMDSMDISKRYLIM